MFLKSSRTIQYVVRNPFASIFATFLGSLGRFPALAKISHFQNHGLQPRLFGQNRPISAQFKCSRKLHEQSRTQLEIHLQEYLRRFQGIWADFQDLPKSDLFKTMGYSPGFLVEIGRFRLIENSPEHFTKKSLRTQKSICKHVGDVFMEFGPISSTCQNQPFSKPWAIAQAFSSKSADFVMKILPKTSRTIPYVVRNPFARLFPTFLGMSRFPTCQNQTCSKPWAIAQAFSSKSADFGPIQMFLKTSRTIPYVVRNRFASIFATFVGICKQNQTCLLQPTFLIGISANLGRISSNLPNLGRFQPKSMFKTMGYSPGFLVKIGRFRLIANSPEHFTKKSLRTQKSICKHVGDVFMEFGPISSTCQNHPCSKPWAIAQAFSSKSADFVYSPGFLSKSAEIQMFPKTSRTIPYVVRNPFASPIISRRFQGRFEFGPISSTCQNQPCSKPWAIAQAFWSKSADFGQFKCSRKLHEQSRTQLEIHLQAYLRRFQGIWADFQHLPKSAMFKTMGYSPGFLVEIGRFRPNSNVPENFTNNPVPSWKSICKHISDVFREFGPISSTYQNPHSSKPWAIAQAFWSKSADFGSLQILPNTSRKSLYALRNPFACWRMLATFLYRVWADFQHLPKSICKHFGDVFRAFWPISHVQNHGLQPRLFRQNRPISS